MVTTEIPIDTVITHTHVFLVIISVISESKCRDETKQYHGGQYGHLASTILKLKIYREATYLPTPISVFQQLI